MTSDFRSVTPGESVQRIVDDHMVGEGQRAVMVARDGLVQGILTVSDIRRVDRRDWPNTPAQQIMTPRDHIVTVEATTPAVEVLQAIAQRSLNQVPVLEEGRMIGLITRRELIDRIQVAEQLAAEEQR
jgi:CBS domain-containing protein